jgi:hypothetical protein
LSTDELKGVTMVSLKGAADSGRKVSTRRWISDDLAGDRYRRRHLGHKASASGVEVFGVLFARKAHLAVRWAACGPL